MELAVCQFLCSVAQDEKQLDKADQAKKILQQLRSLSNERKGIVKNYEDTYQKLPTLGLMGLDALFLLMMQKANMSGITFHLRLSNNANRLLPKNISESDASTLLADLIENALIATSHSQREKAVEVYLCTENNILQICVSDSGSPFPPEVLKKWGIEPFTTHADAGGSGIGMMCIYELCQKYGASFKIEQLQDPSPYCKCVSIRFDGKKLLKPVKLPYTMCKNKGSSSSDRTALVSFFIVFTVDHQEDSLTDADTYFCNAHNLSFIFRYVGFRHFFPISSVDVNSQIISEQKKLRNQLHSSPIFQLRYKSNHLEW